MRLTESEKEKRKAKAVEAYTLRQAGLTYKAIGQKLNVSPEGARQLTAKERFRQRAHD